MRGEEEEAGQGGGGHEGLHRAPKPWPGRPQRGKSR